VLIVEHTEHFRVEKPCILTIGTFDGVHLGHQKLFERLKELKAASKLQTVILTFDPHPRRVLFNDNNNLKLITTTPEKLKLLEEYGMDVAVVYPFSKSFSEISAQQYIEDLLIKKLNVKHLVIGYDHKFGKNRGGDIHTLRDFAPVYGFDVDEISAKDIDSIAISSSKIRHALEQGDITLANKYLGHFYFFSGKVIKGKQLGRTIGFPTANIGQLSAEKLLPAEGVYFARARINDETFFGMLNIGKNPTTDNDQLLKPEINLFNFDRDIYGCLIRVEVLKYLRPEIKFSGIDELKLQLEKDKENCKALINLKHAH
jgi:riboflavin kinase/FMN adenylyltransferase